MTATFPVAEGSSLSMVRHRIPATLDGSANLLLLAFRQWQQRDVDTWLPVAAELEAQHPEFRAYELPVISRAYRPASGFIDGGMRAGIPDPRVRESTITLYVDRRRFLRALEIESVESIVPMLVTRSGEILWRATGARTDESEATLRRAVDSAL